MKKPSINSAGFGAVSAENPAPDPQQVAMCSRWLRRFATTRKSVSRAASSATYKVAVEKWGGAYVSNGAFIAAAVAEGFTAVPNDFFPSTAFFNISPPRKRTPERLASGLK